jgi:hypothetical protein
MSQTDGAKKTIGAVEYTVYRLDPTISYRLARRLGAVLGPAIGAAIGKADGSSVSEANVDLERAARELFDRLDEKLLDDLVHAFGEVSLAGGAKVRDVFSAHFRGRVDEMFEWLAFCLSVEYEGLIKKVRSGIGRVALLRQTPASGSPST